MSKTNSQSVQADGSNVSKLSVKHSDDYIGTFSKNVHIAQCINCWWHNGDLLRRIAIVKEEGKEWNSTYESQDLSQEWYQRKNSVYIPSQVDTCENGYETKTPSRWVCKECSEGDDYDYDGDYEAWSYAEEHIDTPTGISRIVHTKVEGQICNIREGCLFCYPNASHSV
tara:strand:+ start:526 stop:1032 length:507 start_codon:yes stop_codon:yes gene_type:complete